MSIALPSPFFPFLGLSSLWARCFTNSLHRSRGKEARIFICAWLSRRAQPFCKSRGLGMHLPLPNLPAYLPIYPPSTQNLHTLTRIPPPLTLPSNPTTRPPTHLSHTTLSLWLSMRKGSSLFTQAGRGVPWYPTSCEGATAAARAAAAEATVAGCVVVVGGGGRGPLWGAQHTGARGASYDAAMIHITPTTSASCLGCNTPPLSLPDPCTCATTAASLAGPVLRLRPERNPRWLARLDSLRAEQRTLLRAERGVLALLQVVVPAAACPPADDVRLSVGGGGGES
jgi:hypothetical protein